MIQVRQLVAAWCIAAVTAMPAAQSKTAQPGSGPPADEAASLVARFRRLDGEKQDTVVARIERRLQREPSELLQGILAAERPLASYPAQSPPAWFEPSEYAPVAAARRCIGPEQSAHQTATRRIQRFLFLPELQSAVAYEWRSARVVQLRGELSPVERFTNLARGFLPGSDHAIAEVLRLLDADPQQRALGDYFEHLYADRNGLVFAGVSLFDAWNSGIQLEMPDVDAIAYARRVLGSTAFNSPIPADRRRDRLYEQMREGFAAHREYRSLRLAAAAAYVAFEPGLEPTYQPLLRRCHWLWQECNYDPKLFAARLAKAKDRDRWLAEVDAAIRSKPERAEQAQAVYRAWRDYLQQLAAVELQRAED